ncbi:MAG: DUF4445 domain-containing protein [Coriobacteriia bacterium]|nr:DUF4445 domain-containing protein [Coriobacteriia bacterium]
MPTRVPVTFLPADATAWVEPGTTLIEASRRAGVLIAAPCGGRGVCGSCGVRVVLGELAPPDESEQMALSHARGGIRLACRAAIAGPVTVTPLILEANAAVQALGAGADTVAAGVDLGTTTIAAMLVDADTGRELARASVANPQSTYGADVLSRLGASIDGEREALQAAAIQGVASAIAGAAGAAKVDPAAIRSVAIAGNSAMAVLLEGADPSKLAVHPFQPPVLSAHLDVRGALAPEIAADARVSVLPPIAGFVGGDSLAGLLVGGMIQVQAPTLLVDFGTNAEILLAGVGSLVVASAAAGPAFEGVGISCGGPAASGGVSSVRLHEDGVLEFAVIGGGAPEWLTGSGLLSLVAELRRVGHIDSGGALLAPGPLADSFSVDAAGVKGIRLDATGGLLLTQLDVRALQLAKAAVRVGIDSVLEVAGIRARDLESVQIAGAFGAAIEPSCLTALGIVPALVGDRVRHVGNASLEGAALVALDPSLEALALESARRARHVNLASSSGFAAALMQATEFAPYG